MLIEKNMDITINIDSKIVSEYFNSLKISRDGEELKNLLDNTKEDILSYITAYYLSNLHIQDEDKFAKFIGEYKKNKSNLKQSNNESQIEHIEGVYPVGTIFSFNLNALFFSSTLYQIVGYGAEQTSECNLTYKFKRADMFSTRYETLTKSKFDNLVRAGQIKIIV